MTASKASAAGPPPTSGLHSPRKKDSIKKKLLKKRKISSLEQEQEEIFVSEAESPEKATGSVSNSPDDNDEPKNPPRADGEKLQSKRKKTRKHAANTLKAEGDVCGSTLATAGNNAAETEAATGEEGEAAEAETEAAAAAEEAAAGEGEADDEVMVYRQKEIIDSSQTFRDFGATHLDRRLTKALIDDLKLQHPTHVQSKVMLLLLL